MYRLYIDAASARVYKGILFQDSHAPFFNYWGAARVVHEDVDLHTLHSFISCNYIETPNEIYTLQSNDASVISVLKITVAAGYLKLYPKFAGNALSDLKKW